MFTLECWLPSEVIKAQGDWASNVYENYINRSWEMRKHIAVTLGRYIQ